MKTRSHTGLAIILCNLIGLGFGAGLTQAHAASPDALRPPVKEVLADYQKIEQALANDSLQNVAETAQDISKAVRASDGKSLSLSVAERSDALAKAHDLKSARTAFKPLSETLILYLDQNKVNSTGLKLAFCPMEKARWLQKAGAIRNPYMGKAMPSCGEFKQTF